MRSALIVCAAHVSTACRNDALAMPKPSVVAQASASAESAMAMRGKVATRFCAARRRAGENPSKRRATSKRAMGNAAAPACVRNATAGATRAAASAGSTAESVASITPSAKARKSTSAGVSVCPMTAAAASTPSSTPRSPPATPNAAPSATNARKIAKRVAPSARSVPILRAPLGDRRADRPVHERRAGERHDVREQRQVELQIAQQLAESRERFAGSFDAHARRDDGCERRAHARERAVDHAIDAIEQAVLRKHRLRRREVHEDDARVDARCIGGQHIDDLQRGPSRTGQRIEAAAAVQAETLREARGDDRAVARDRARRVDGIAVGCERTGAPLARSAHAGQRAQEIDADEAQALTAAARGHTVIGRTQSALARAACPALLSLSAAVSWAAGAGPMPPNTERAEPDRPPSDTVIGRLITAHAATPKTPPAVTLQLLDTTHQTNFDSGSDALTDAARAQLDTFVASLRTLRARHVLVSAHTDSVRLVRDAKRRFGTNQRLSEARAARVVEYLSGAVPLPQSAFAIQGFGAARPVAGNDNAAGRAQNRRAEVAVWVEREVPPPTPPPVPETRLQTVSNCIGNAADQLPAVRITVDGVPLDSREALNEDDRQRCVDVALARAEIQIRFDPLEQQPFLNTIATPQLGVVGKSVSFRTYTNYPRYIDHAEISQGFRVPLMDRRRRPRSSRPRTPRHRRRWPC